MLGRRPVAAVVLLALIATGCASGPTPSPGIAPVVGGTLRIGVSGGAESLTNFAYVDPARLDSRDAYPWLAGCCVARTLLTYPGRVTADGGTVLQPDLATELPEISGDGLTWTFRLRPGIRYAPPYDDGEVEARDIIATVERNARLNPDLTIAGPGLAYGYVVGAADYAAGNAPNIAGLSAPDTHTLVVRLIEPFGAFGVLIADFAWSPQPPAVLEGHAEDLGRHWVSTGPYMYETYPAPESGGSATLVRNPSWQRDTDPRRGAWVDRIELVGYEDPEAGFGMIERGEFDIGDSSVPGTMVDRYRTDPSFEHRLREASGQYLVWISLNLAVPPFDDVAVRRAVNLVVDRAAVSNLIVEGRSDPGFPQAAAVVTQHTFPDSLTGGLLLSYAPFESSGNHGDLAGARAEMAGFPIRHGR